MEAASIKAVAGLNFYIWVNYFTNIVFKDNCALKYCMLCVDSSSLRENLKEETNC